MAILAIVAGILIYFLNGLVLSKLWLWFIVPFGTEPISISWAIGISIIVSFASWQESVKKNQEIDGVATYVQAFLRPLFALGIGWIVKGFM